MYNIVFDNINYMYYEGRCFEDTSGIFDIGSILDCIYEKEDDFKNVIEEKGKITKASKEFETDTLFYAIEQIHKDDDYIFLDDLGTEWCDHITINKKTNTINFIHSKAKPKKVNGKKENITSLSASNLQDVVGQGIKNLGNMRFSWEEFESVKRAIILNEKYTLEEVKSKIKRIRIPEKKELDENDIVEIKKVINNYQTHRICILSCSFLSRDKLEKEFQKIEDKESVNGNVTQLFWILSSFIHACRGADIIPRIYCRA